MGWLDRIVRRQMGLEGLERDAAEVAARVNILARGDEDRRRRREAGPITPVARWRWASGHWERWSFLEESFVADEAPHGLLDHVAAVGGPRDGEELELVDGTWRRRGDDHGDHGEEPGPALAAAPADAAVPSPVAPPPATAPAATADLAPDPAPAPTDVAAQIEAWRRRAR